MIIGLAALVGGYLLMLWATYEPPNYGDPYDLSEFSERID